MKTISLILAIPFIGILSAGPTNIYKPRVIYRTAAPPTGQGSLVILSNQMVRVTGQLRDLQLKEQAEIKRAELQYQTKAITGRQLSQTRANIQASYRRQRATLELQLNQIKLQEFDIRQRYGLPGETKVGKK